MFFKRIELNGFKSFADPVTIEFNEGITCIVGPNGSGKSNISDAILWVLGEQSPKTLRSGKMEEVIFAGTQSRKAKGMAEVTLVIDNSDHSLPIDYAEVGITRRMYRSGESEYLINRTPCRLRDIRELIMDTGIGVEGYSIIGQGKIADIVSNKMESRREIFEEAAGIVKYRSKKTETEKKLASATDNLSRVNDIVREIESRIGGLKADSEKATEYLEIRDKYKDVEINIILKNIEAADSKTAAVREELEVLEKEIAGNERDKAALENGVRALREKAAELELSLEELRGEITGITEEIHEISSREELNKEKLASLEKDKARLESELGAADEKIAKEQAGADQLKAALDASAAEGKSLKAALDSCHKAFEAAQNAYNEADKSFEEQKNTVFSVAADLGTAMSQKDSVANLKDTLERRAERLREDADLKDRNDKQLSEKLTNSAAELEALTAENEKLKIKLDAAKASQIAAECRLDASIQDTESIKVAAGRLSARHTLLDELEKSYEGYGGGVKFLMTQNIKGIIGTLGQLLEVPSGLEIAIETVLGAKLQDIVCKDDDTAKKSIEILKTNKAGRLTFLPVESLRVQPALDCTDIAGCPGFMGLASEKVSCRGGYTNVVEYMLGRVVIADNLDNAITMSAKNAGPFRFVTLEGEVVNAAGAITGGSFKNNTANILSRKAELLELEKKIRENEAKLKLAGEARREAEKDIADASEEKHGAENAISANLLKMAGLEKEIQITNQAMTDASGADEKRLAELAELDREINAAQTRIEDTLGRIKALEKQKSQAEEEISVLAGKLDELKAASDKAQEAETAAKLAVNAAELKTENTRQLLELSTQTVNELSAGKAEKEKELYQTTLMISQIEQFKGGAASVLEEKQALKAKLTAEAERKAEDRTRAAGDADRMDAERAGMDKVLYENQQKKHDADLRAARFDAQTETLKEKLWDEFEMSYAEAAAHEDPDFVMSRALKESREYKDRLRAIGDVNIGAIEEYKQVKERYDFLTSQRDDITRAMDELRGVIDDMDSIIRKRFKESFDSVALNFEETFRELFKGGHATLSMEDETRPLETAIEIEAQPPGKKLQNITLLSGGERTMTAIALMFAVLKSKPTPFCILDEVEAALDEANIECFAKYVRTIKNTQFALVTHQKLTMEFADVLYGVTMPEHGITKVLSLKLGDDFEV